METNTKKVYAEPTLEQREKLVEVTEQKPIISGSFD